MPRYRIASVARLALCSAPPGPFTLETMCVRAWQANPGELGLRGFKSLYPDVNRILSAIYGAKGLEKLGYIKRISPKGDSARVYELTRNGREAIADMKRGEYRKLTQDAHASCLCTGNGKHTWECKIIHALLKKDAVNSRRDEITFVMAKNFFGALKPKYRMRRLAKISESDDHKLAREARALRALADHLMERFKHHFGIAEARGKAS